ncbi:ubiquitin carboxyl-terminal hydrolase 4 [Thecamonas trahens ATCC 50062]|uniref:Ubiquitin carboxyl-terminal hydrolase n=1 Tax=Thecamonas trahens ATCC 50062 TaxID=461836 RepID=A0A0L0DRB5_THETB|nr:ubiquitin carboxyl-terminal hydrolase 4 [Thecamonas trahens ATCC 50062]KNC53988.1 ubiquitin carboxyl-terminal hydrolase 4 [Thecamonas trahens ATCC 50062]|eukprot:XP_013754190.1 ubiquitin carboxyl-terminal hydrolase 4 [Thecamonas trahens ATCC 50062]
MSTIPPVEKQHETYLRLKDKPLQGKATWCVVSAPWMEAFVAHVASGAPHPGPISNDHLVAVEDGDEDAETPGEENQGLAGNIDATENTAGKDKGKEEDDGDGEETKSVDSGGGGKGVAALPRSMEELEKEALEPPRLRKDIRADVDYVLVPQELYANLEAWYGGGPQLARQVVAVGQRRELRVDLYPVTVYTLRWSATSKCIDVKSVHKIWVSTYLTFVMFRLDACAGYSTPPYSTRFWLMPDLNAPVSEYRMVEKDEMKLLLGDLGVQDETIFLIETQDSDKKWPLDRVRSSAAGAAPAATAPASAVSAGATSRSWATSGVETSRAAEAGRALRTGAGATRTSAWSRTSYGSRPGKPPVRGATGLSNLGNTCFMNSALQCLSNTTVLTEYFLSGAYTDDVNTTNPLGMEGKLATVYAELVRDLWSGQYTSVSPTRFKALIGKFAPQFSGFQQHDSQELLGFLLDGLHEDLNRVLDKPPTEKLESDGRPDAEVAAEAWERHLLRNKSFIVDTFQAQFKSTVVCPAEGCGRVSITFDPYLYLQLPLPVKNSKLVHAVVSSLDKPAIKVAVQVSVHSTLADVRQQLAETLDIESGRLVFADVYGSRMLNTLPPWRPVRQMRDGVVQRVFLVSHEVADPVKPVYTATSYYTRGGAAAKAKAAAAKAAAEADAPDAAPAPPAAAIVQVIQRRKIKSAYQPSRTVTTYRMGLFGLPLVFTYLDGTLTNAQLRAQVVNAVRTKACVSDPGAELFDAVDAEGNRLVSLVLVSSTGTVCALCPSKARCSGCEIPDDETLASVDLLARSSVAVHWSAAALEKAQVIGVAAGTATATGAVIERDLEEHPSVKELKAASKTEVNLASCLEAFAKEETLSEDDMWYCSKCSEFRQARKKMEVWSTPKILVIQLKRFTFSSRIREKISCVVDFPLEGLDMAPYVMDSSSGGIYDLFAVSRHSGGLGGGHYTAVARSAEDGEWYLCNDSHVSRTSADRVVDPSAYLLFYVRRDE